MKNTVKIDAGNARIIAHRGVSGLERENTASAFVAAGNRGYFGIETDVHVTADGKLILIHDSRTERVTGEKYIVEETNFETLRELHLLDLEEQPRYDLRLPSLQEYIHICRSYGKTSVLELKGHFDPKDVDKVVDAVTAEGWLQNTVFISFYLPNLIRIRELLPKQPIQYLAFEMNDEVLKALEQYHMDLDIDFRKLSAEDVQAVHDLGMKVNVWTVNTAEDGKRLLNMGVDYITTNILEPIVPQSESV